MGLLAAAFQFVFHGQSYSLAKHPADPTASDSLEPILEEALSKIRQKATSLEGDEALYSFFEVEISSFDPFNRIVKGDIPLSKCRKLLFDPKEDWRTKNVLSKALVRIGGRESAILLRDTMASKTINDRARRFAAFQMGHIASNETNDLIEEAVENNGIHWEYRTSIMSTLGVVGYDNVDWLKRVSLGKIFPPTQKTMTINEAAGFMWSAMRALGHSKNPRATDILIELQEMKLSNGILAEALRNRKDPRAIPTLLKVLNHHNPDPKASLSREEAAQALGELRAKEAIEPLIRIVQKDGDHLTILRSAEALANIGDKRALPVLRALVENIETDSRFQTALETYLAQERHGTGPILLMKAALRKLEQ